MLKLASAALAAAAFLIPVAASAHDCGRGAFNGLYIGASVGYARNHAEQFPEGEAKLSGHSDGVIAGGQLGYNLQCGRLVVGVEGDISYLDSSVKTAQPDPAYYTSSTDWLGTLRGRLGVTLSERVMIYGTLGAAWSDRTHKLDAPAAPGGPFLQSDKDSSTGLVWGVGAEFVHDRNWLIRAEVLNIDYDKVSRDYVIHTSGCGGGTCTAHVDWKDDPWVARIGISYLFGAPEPAYEPLK
ncbi:MAG: porin family protein [Proteobacteria bacterium]|nr:porin family protein [Pseudomonadota bacterium]